MREQIPTVDASEENRPTIAFRPNTLREKAEIERQVAQSDEYGNLSHLIRKSVKRELAGMYEPNSGGNTNAGVSESQFNQVLDKLDSLQGEVNNLSEGVDNAIMAVQSGGSISESTLTEVYRSIPTNIDAATTASGISQGTDLDRDTVSLALEQLAENHAAVNRIPWEELPNDETTTTTWNGREIPIEGVKKAVKRRNPIYFKEA